MVSQKVTIKNPTGLHLRPAGITIVNSSTMEVSLYPATDNTALIALPQEGVAGIADQTEHTENTENTENTNE